MKQLDPKAKWLFFLSFLGRTIPIFIPLVVVVISFSASGRAAYTRWIDTFMVWVPVALVIIVVSAWVWAALSYRFYKYELRADGFRKESGIIWKKYTTIPYDRIQNVDIYRGLIARILGISDLHIQTAGAVPMQANRGAFSEGRLPGLSRAEAEKIRDELVKRVRKNSKGQGL